MYDCFARYHELIRKINPKKDDKKPSLPTKKSSVTGDSAPRSSDAAVAQAQGKKKNSSISRETSGMYGQYIANNNIARFGFSKLHQQS